MYVDQMPLHDRISALNLPTGSYALAGDAGLAAYGLLEAGRIDLIVTPEVFRGLPEQGWNALPGTDGKVLAIGDVTARTRLHNLSHLSTIDFVSDVDQVAGLPVLRLPVLRQSVAASGATDAVLWRLGLIDQLLAAAPYAQQQAAVPYAQPTRLRSRTSWAYLRGVITAPGHTFVADRGASMWGTAFVLWCGVFILGRLAQGGSAGPSLVGLILGTPLAAGFALLIRRGVTGIARRFCGGDPDLGSATASQAAVVVSLTTVPVVVAEHLPLPVAWTSLATVVVVGFALFIGFWLIGMLYSAAFDCSVGRGVLGEVVGTVSIVLVFVAVSLAFVGLPGG